MGILKRRGETALRTQGVKPNRIKSYNSIEEIIKDVEFIKVASKEEGTDRLIDMIYKLCILYQGCHVTVELDNGVIADYSKYISKEVWDAINDMLGQLKEDFPEEKMFKNCRSNPKNMYIGNFLYVNEENVYAGISLLEERTGFSGEYEIGNKCRRELLDEETCVKLEKSAKKYLQAKKVYSIE